MKVLAVTLLALVAVASAKNINFEDVVDLEDITAYDYHSKIGIQLAKEIRETEAQDAAASRIAGGSFSDHGQFPYQVGLIIDLSGTTGQSVCGGVIVNQWRVLTAAHCWWDGRNQAWRFTLVGDSITLFSGGQRITSSDVEMHASWNPSLIRDDIAIARLPTPFNFNNNINAIRLPTGSEINENFAGETSIASGYGRRGDGIFDGITTGQRLSHVELTVITNAVCAQSFNIVVPSTICTSGAGGRSTCGGDSGGPLATNRNNQRVLIGLTSFGSAAGCTRGFPAAFVRVTSFIDWINARL